MTNYPVPANEIERLRVLRSLGIDFSAPIRELQDLTEVASRIASTPIALVSLVDDDVQNFAANTGLPGVNGTDRDVAFCAHAIMSSEQLVVPDAQADERFKGNPLVMAAPEIRAYAGSVLEPECGVRVGTLCVIDTKPREFSTDVLDQLKKLSEVATSLLRGHRDRLALRERLDLEERLQTKLRRQAKLDPLTGLLNQAGFRAAVGEALASGSGQENLLVIDVDHFKQVNDRWGHPFGDQYLKAIAEGLRSGLGEAAVLGRIGGDEFGALVTTGHAEELVGAIQETRSIIRGAAVDLKKPELGHLSIGLCPATKVADRNFEALFQRADIALYASKERGRNMTTVFSPELDAIFNLRTLRARFSNALLEGEVVPFFQPQVDLNTQQIVGFELLARWQDPMRGLLMPAHFHKVLTDRSVGPELTRRMLSGAIEAQVAARRLGTHTVRMAINVTHHDLSGLDFLQIVEWRLEEAGLDWSHLSFELTERSILDDPHRDVEKTLSAIRERGGEVALDDFGTGHAGLLHLRDWPIDVLKLDATFVRDASDNGRNEAILKSMIELAERLDLQVIAEGIEAVGIAEKLREMGCSCGQGFLFSPAVSQPDALELLSGKAQTSFSVGRPGRAL